MKGLAPIFEGRSLWVTQARARCLRHFNDAACPPGLVTGTAIRHGGGRISEALLLGACLLLGAPQATALENRSIVNQSGSLVSPTYEVNLQDNLLSIESNQMPWTKVLGAIRKKTGIRFHYSIPLPGSVTVSFKALPMRQALERLFGPEAYFILRYPIGSGSPVEQGLVPLEVWVLGKVAGDIAGGTPERKSAEGATETKSSSMANPDTEPEMPEDVAEPIPTPEEIQAAQDEIDTLIGMTKHDDPAQRLQALLSLSGHDKIDAVTVRSSLETALTDRDANVRTYAVQTLASHGGPEAMGYLWQALRDPDPAVRIVAVQMAVPKEQAFLQAALSDKDEHVRSIAVLMQKQEQEPSDSFAQAPANRAAAPD